MSTPTPDEEIAPVALADLATTWRTLLDVAWNYRLGSPGNLALIEACRLIEVEVRAQHGDTAWEQMTTAPRGSSGR